MTKVVINTCHGGFGLSDKAMTYYNQLSGYNQDSYWNIGRDDPYLIQTVNELGGEANGNYSKLKIVEIPDDVEWEIQEYDGREWVAEKHRTWN